MMRNRFCTSGWASRLGKQVSSHGEPGLGRPDPIAGSTIDRIVATLVAQRGEILWTSNRAGFAEDWSSSSALH